MSTSPFRPKVTPARLGSSGRNTLQPIPQKAINSIDITASDGVINALIVFPFLKLGVVIVFQFLQS